MGILEASGAGGQGLLPVGWADGLPGSASGRGSTGRPFQSAGSQRGVAARFLGGNFYLTSGGEKAALSARRAAS